MKKVIIRIYIDLLSLLFVTFFTLIPAYAQESLNLQIVYPKDNANINAYSTFFIGNTTPGAKLKINNERVKVYPNGGFVHVINLNPGTNVINISSALGETIKKMTRTIYTPQYEVTIPQSPLKIKIDSITPQENVVYKAGDLLQVSFKGSTGNKAYFSIGNKRKNIPMAEQSPKYIRQEPVYGSSVISSVNPVKGIYKGTYRIKSHDKFSNEPLIVKLVSNRNKVDYKTKTIISTVFPDSPPTIARIKTDYATVRNYPGKSRLTPLPEGTLITLTGRQGNNFRFKMGNSLNGWILGNDITVLPEGTPVSESSIDLINIVPQDDSVCIKIPLSQKLPIVIDQDSENSMSLKIFGAKANIDLFSYDHQDKFLKEVKWFQETNDTVKIDIKAASKQFWGYKYYYEGDTLVLELKKPPLINPDNPLKNITICLDPGHGGQEEGAIGPTGIPEKEVNLQIALKLKKILEGKGAKVIMTRATDEEVGLYDRVKYAVDNDSLILLSIHNNSLPDGRNPYKEHGTSSYYYHSQSLPLAKILQKALLEDLNFNDFGIFWSSFALTRPPEVLAVLMEIGFMINPDEYDSIIDPAFQDKIAASIARGLEYFLFVNSDRPKVEIFDKTQKN